MNTLIIDNDIENEYPMYVLILRSLISWVPTTTVFLLLTIYNSVVTHPSPPNR